MAVSHAPARELQQCAAPESYSMPGLFKSRQQYALCDRRQAPSDSAAANAKAVQRLCPSADKKTCQRGRGRRLHPAQSQKTLCDSAEAHAVLSHNVRLDALLCNVIKGLAPQPVQIFCPKADTVRELSRGLHRCVKPQGVSSTTSPKGALPWQAPTIYPAHSSSAQATFVAIATAVATSLVG